MAQEMLMSNLEDDTGRLGTAAKVPPAGSGADVTASAVAAAISGMTAAQKAGVRTDIDAEPAKLIVTVTESSGTYAANKTFSQMWTAYNTDHKTVTVKMGEAEFVLSSANPSGMAFTSLSVVSGVTTIKILSVDDNNDWTYQEASGGSGLSSDAKAALLACFAHVAWTDDQGQTYVDALEAALYPLDHITAVYTQSGTVYNTDSLDSLKADLVVTAVYDSGNTETVPAANYTLGGTLTEGTSTITVSYGGKTTTFNVTVTESATYTLTENDFLRGYGNTGQYGPEPHYAGAAANRISYNKFDLLLEAGKQYVVAATATAAYKDSAQMALQYFNQNALNTVASHGTIATADIDTNTNNWGNLSITITVPATINNSPTKGARITFRQSSANPDISSDFRITSLTISEVSA